MLKFYIKVFMLIINIMLLFEVLGKEYSSVEKHINNVLTHHFLSTSM